MYYNHNMRLLHTLQNIDKNHHEHSHSSPDWSSRKSGQVCRLDLQDLPHTGVQGNLPRHSCGKVPPCSGPWWGKHLEVVGRRVSSSFQSQPPCVSSVCAVSAPSQRLPHIHNGHTWVQWQQDHWKSEVMNFAASWQGTPPSSWHFSEELRGLPSSWWLC